MSAPREMLLSRGDWEFKVRFEYDPGEKQWFDPLRGIGHPGEYPSVRVLEVDYGDGNGWSSPDNPAYPPWYNSLEDEILDRMWDEENT